MLLAEWQVQPHQENLATHPGPSLLQGQRKIRHIHCENINTAVQGDKPLQDRCGWANQPSHWGVGEAVTEVSSQPASWCTYHLGPFSKERITSSAMWMCGTIVLPSKAHVEAHWLPCKHTFPSPGFNWQINSSLTTSTSWKVKLPGETLMLQAGWVLLTCPRPTVTNMEDSQRAIRRNGDLGLGCNALKIEHSWYFVHFLLLLGEQWVSNSYAKISWCARYTKASFDSVTEEEE